MFKKIIRMTLLAIIVYVLFLILFGLYWQHGTKKICNEFADNARSNPVLMDKTFKAILSVKTIKNFYPYNPGHSVALYRQHKDNNLISTIDWKGIFNDVDYENYSLVYQYSPKYKKEVQSGIVSLDMIDNVYIGNTRVGLRFIFKRTQQGDIDKNNYGLNAECDLLGDIPRVIKIK